MSNFVSQPAFEIGRRIELRGLDGYSWFVVLGPGDYAALEAFKQELGATVEAPVRLLTIADRSLSAVREALFSPPDDVVILSGFEGYDADRWRTLDIHRTALVRPGSIVLWLSPTTLAQLCSDAPNLRSFIGGSIFVLSESGQAMTEQERSARIQELELHYKMSSDTVLELAGMGTLPPEPQFVEWLVLLERGDLV